jgi:hypothetical protein
MLPSITDTALNALSQSARQLQAELLDRTGERYDLPDLNDVLARWLESAIEALCELCVTGDRTHASFNRPAFAALLAQVPSVNVWQQQAEVFQQSQDQMAMALDRAA